MLNGNSIETDSLILNKMVGQFSAKYTTYERDCSEKDDRLY